VTRSRLLVPLLALAGVLLWFAWPRTPAPRPDGPHGAAGAVPTAPGTAAANGVNPAATSAANGDAPERTATTDGEGQWTIAGHVLAVGRVPVAGAEVVAYRGIDGESPGVMNLLAGGAPAAGPGAGLRADAIAALTSGPELAHATVGPDAAFALRSPERHVRLALRHDLYGLDLPQVVHVPAATRRADVVLTPYLGGCLRGRLLGSAPRVASVRLLLEPDPMGAMHDPTAFFGAMLNAERGPVPPAADGTFVFRAVPAAGELLVLAEGDGVAGRNRLATLRPGETREIALPVDDAGALTVRVVDAGDQPLAHARVDAWPDEPASDTVRVRTSLHGESDAAGAAVLRPLLPGRWHVAAHLRGRLEAEGSAELPREDTLVLRLGDGGAIAGIVVDDHGAPLADARVATFLAMKVPMLGDLADQIGADALAKATADGVRTAADGRFRLDGVDPAAPCTVIAAHEGFVAATAREVAVGRTDVRLELQPAAALTGRAVAAESEAPLPDFVAEVQTTMFLTITRPVQRVPVRGAAEGAFRIDGLPTGSFTLVLAAEGRPETRSTIALRAGQTTDVGAVRVSRGAAVRGVVRDADGNRIPRALVQPSRGGLADNPAMALLQPPSTSTRTDDHGEFALVDLPPGRQQLIASAEGFASGKSERLVLAAAAEVTGVEIVLDHGGRIAGTLQVAAGTSPD
jgi:hypothetical protein